jgi:hypothetical protein
MSAEQVFAIASNLAMLGWLALLVAGRKPVVSSRITGVVIPLLLAFAYTSLVASQLRSSEGGFGSLAEVATLFRNPWVLLAGWIHYLAFDLFIGSWEVRDGARHGIPHWQTIPFLIATFLLGPAGLLGYFLLRRAHGVPFAANSAG